MPHILNRHDRATLGADSAPETDATNLRHPHGQLDDRAARGAKGGRTSRGAKPRALLLCGLFAALLIADAAPAGAAGDCSPGGFRTARDFEAGPGNWGLARKHLVAADFNGDERVDLATTDRDHHTVDVMLNEGGGWFGATIKYGVGLGPSAVGSADFNGDGRADLAVVNRDSDNVSILLGGAGGVFGTATNFAVGAQPESIVVADFNGDGRADIAVMRQEARVSLLLGDGAGAFMLGTGASYLTGFVVDAADFNSDGKRDLVVTNSGVVSVLAGDGAGGFPANSSSFRHGGTSAVAADLNGDGKADLALGSFGGIVILLGDGAGGFPAPTVVNVGINDSLHVHAVGDLDEDGKLDILATSSFAGLTLFKGDGAGGFSRGKSYLSVNIQSAAVVIADFDADGRRDIALAAPGNLPAASNLAPGVVSVLLNEGGGDFQAARKVYTPGRPSDFALGDFNADGIADMVVVYRRALVLGPPRADTRVTFHLGDASGEFTPTFTVDRPGSIGFNAGLATADFNKDGKADVAVGLPRGPSASVSINLSNGDGTFAAPHNVSVPLTGFDFQLVAGDFNGDANPDVVAFAPDAQAFAALLGDGAGNFSTTTAQAVGMSVFGFSAAAADLNGDGIDDLISADYSNARVQIFLGTSAGRFDEARDAGVLGRPRAVAVGDFNRDGKRDVAVSAAPDFGGGIRRDALFFEETVSVLLGDGAGGFAPAAVVYRDPSDPSSLPNFLSAADFDGDGDADLAVGFTRRTLFLSGDGDGGFGHAVPIESNEFFARLVAHDFNADGRADLAVNVSVDASSIGILFSKGPPQPCLSADDVTVVEGDEGTPAAQVTVRLSAASEQVVTVNYLTDDDGLSAKAGADFSARAGVLTFQPGETAKTVNVPVLDDILGEDDETFVVRLRSPLNARIGDGLGVVKIVDDEAPHVQFGAVALAVSEADGSVQAPVTRVGDLSRACAVNYSTGGGTASGRSDYNLALGTLFFEPGEASKTITIFVTDDALVEDAETFEVALSGPVGCSLGPPSVASVTLNSEDAAAGPNPADDTAFFVRQHYRDFLSREPDAAGFAFWTGEIESCGADAQCREIKRINVSAAFFLSIEFQETGFLVYRIYDVAYGDAVSPGVAGAVPAVRLNEFLPDTQRIGRGVVVRSPGWEQALEANKQAYALEFVRRPRFLTAFHPAMTAAQFVDKLNQNAGGVLSQEERDRLVARLSSAPDANAGRAAALRQVADSDALRRKEFNRAFVLMQYFGYLRRNPDDAPEPGRDYGGWKFWLDKLNEFDGDFVRAEMVKAFLTSAEYRNRFGQ